MLHNELFYTLALLKVEGIGDVVAKKLIKHCGSAAAVFQTSKKSLIAIEGIGEYLYKNLQQKKIFNCAENELRFIENESISYTTFEENSYPERLKHCADGPIILFQSGTIDLQNRKIINIVGTRQITSYGIDFTKKLISDLAPLNPVIVSGFAYGVDIVAHQAAIQNGYAGATGWFFPIMAMFTGSILNFPKVFNAGLLLSTVTTTGHSLLPSAK